MIKGMLRFFFLACFVAVHFTLAAEHGVGFGLSADYGVASIYFSNGSSVDLAKIEGGPAYKRMMRTAGSSTEATVRHPTLIDAFLHPRTQLSLALESLRNHLPPWIRPNDTTALPLSRMLQALRTASESYLETPLAGVEVVVPFPASDAFLRTLRSTCSSLGIYLPLSAPPPAGILAARAYGIGRGCPDDDQWYDEQLILTVDYSRAALTALLVYEDCGYFEMGDDLHNTTLGADALSTSSDRGRADLARALRKITRLPLHIGNGAGLTEISELILIGESAGDKQLQDVLKEVLSEQSDSLLKGANERRTGVIDPIFAASRGVAYDCWDRLEYSASAESETASIGS
ncbi:MAG: hypothetical protein Q9166_008220, partial [cf. Caloplaca sp. 2 TL-2023]